MSVDSLGGGHVDADHIAGLNRQARGERICEPDTVTSPGVEPSSVYCPLDDGRRTCSL